LNYSLSRDVGVYAGYGDGNQRDLGLAGGNRAERQPRFNFGIDYARALSLTRRTKLMFSTGTAGVQDRIQHETNYNLIGAIGLTREFGRTWNAVVAYSRNVRYVESLGEPLHSHSLAAMAAGSLGRRIEFKSSLSASTGRLGAGAGNAFDSYFGIAQVSFGLSRHFGLGADYGYSRLLTLGGPLLVDVLEFRRLSQQSIRAYLKIWAPLLSRPRRP
jgi:hypothetical protein